MRKAQVALSARSVLFLQQPRLNPERQLNQQPFGDASRHNLSPNEDEDEWWGG